MKFNEDLFLAIKYNDEEKLLIAFLPLINKLCIGETASSVDDLKQELNIELLLIFRKSKKKLDVEFLKYIERLKILEKNSEENKR